MVARNIKPLGMFFFVLAKTTRFGIFVDFIRSCSHYVIFHLMKLNGFTGFNGYIGYRKIKL